MQLSDALKKMQLFQTASEILEAPAPAGDANEIILPSKLLTRLFITLRSGEMHGIHLTVRGNEVVGLEGHDQRVKREKEVVTAK